MCVMSVWCAKVRHCSQLENASFMRHGR
jgi:hypothetical protein